MIKWIGALFSRKTKTYLRGKRAVGRKSSFRPTLEYLEDRLTPTTPGTIHPLLLGSPTSTAVVSSQTPAVYGTPVTFAATVTAASGIPTGSVDFLDVTTGTHLGNGTVAASGGVSTEWDLTTAATQLKVTAGDTIQATYTPGAGFIGSFGSVTQVVTPAPLSVLPGGTSAWSSANAMTFAAHDQTATLLNNGMVLVTGGLDDTAILTDAELYNPATNSWAPAAPMSVPRFKHAATLLPNGKVLVTGGDDGNESVAQAELYDPATNSWSSAGTMADGRFYQTATLLQNGKVLIAGGQDDNGPVATAELYDPASNSWSSAGLMATARFVHSATLLPNGKVLIAGGTDDFGNDLSSTELYDPATNSWSGAAPCPSPGRCKRRPC